MRNKQIKLNVGQGRPTETKALSTFQKEEAWKWIGQIDKCDDVMQVVDVVRGMINGTKDGSVDKEVVYEVIRQRKILGSLYVVYQGSRR